MKPAIVLRPGKIKSEKDGIFLVINVPTIEVTVSIVPVRLGNLNVFQKGVAYLLLAGVRRVEELAQLMGITDEDFVMILLSELVNFEYTYALSAREFSPTKKLESEFSQTIVRDESSSLKTVVFIPYGDRNVKIIGPLPSNFVSSPIVATTKGLQVAVGTEGNPLQVDCLVSDVDLPIKKVDRSTAKDWIFGQLPNKPRKGEVQSEKTVEIIGTRSRPFVVQCQIKNEHRLRSLPKRPEQLQDWLTVKFVGDDRTSKHLNKHLLEIARQDSLFFESILSRLNEIQEEFQNNSESTSQNLESNFELEEVISIPPHERTRQRTEKKVPLKWIVEILTSRLAHLRPTQIEGMLVGEISIERQISERLMSLGSPNCKPVVPPLSTTQLEALAANQLHNELEICPVLGVWLLLEKIEVMNELVQLNENFVGGLCDIFLNPHVAVGKEMRETFKYLVPIGGRQEHG